MLKYGRKIIQYLFKKRQKCHGIRVVFASRSEADCDRSHIRMFEIGLSSEQYGDYEQGTRVAAQTYEGERLIGISRTEGTFVPKEKWGCLELTPFILFRLIIDYSKMLMLFKIV